MDSIFINDKYLNYNYIFDVIMVIWNYNVPGENMTKEYTLDEITDIVIHVKYEDLETMEYPKNELIYLIVEYENFDYEFLLKDLENNDKLTVLGSGAFNKSSNYDRSGPWFNRWSWTFEDSVLYYHDPTLYLADDIYGPWGLGTPEVWYLEKIAIITEKIAQIMSVNNKDILFYGSSAGGFTSLMLSILVKDSVCLAEVPQLDITSWGSFWRPLKNASFDMDDAEFIEKYGNRVSVFELIKERNYIPNAYILMDCSAEYDFTRQYLPFFKRLNKLSYNIKDNTMKLFIFGKNTGHSALPKDVILSIIKHVRHNEFYVNNPQIKPERYPQDYDGLLKTCDDYRRRINQLNKDKNEDLLQIASLESLVDEKCKQSNESLPLFTDDSQINNKLRDKNQLILYLNDLLKSYRDNSKQKQGRIDELSIQLKQSQEQLNKKQEEYDLEIARLNEKISSLTKQLEEYKSK